MQGNHRSIEVWVIRHYQPNQELPERPDRGHVELRVNGIFFGFWPDLLKRNPVIRKTPPRHNHPLFGGFAGVMLPNTEEELLESYELLSLKDRRAARANPIGERIHFFHKFVIPVSSLVDSALFDYLQNLSNKVGPEYQLNAEDGAHNCVSISIEALASHGAVDSHFRVPSNNQMPGPFLIALKALRERMEGITYSILELSTVKFVPTDDSGKTHSTR